jgi:acyl-coenzyme A thioesterase PaaI-like protein
MESRTHLNISSSLVGEVVELSPGKAVARLHTLPEMGADEHGLVHGGFAFGLADYAAMLAVNDPHVVLGWAESRFLAPVRVGETLVAKAEITEEKGRKRIVKCSVATDRVVFEGAFTCFVLDNHVFDS